MFACMEVIFMKDGCPGFHQCIYLLDHCTTKTIEWTKQISKWNIYEV